MVGADLLIETLELLDVLAADTEGFESFEVPVGPDLAGQVLDGQAAIEVLKRLSGEARAEAVSIFRAERARLEELLNPTVSVPMMPESLSAAVALAEHVRRARIVDPELDRLLPPFHFF